MIIEKLLGKFKVEHAILENTMMGSIGKRWSFLCLTSMHMHEHVNSNVSSTMKLRVCCGRYASVRSGRSPTRHRCWLVEVNSVYWNKLSVCMPKSISKSQIISSISSLNLRIEEECCIKIIHICFFRTEYWKPKGSKEFHPSSRFATLCTQTCIPKYVT